MHVLVKNKQCIVVDTEIEKRRRGQAIFHSQTRPSISNALIILIHQGSPWNAEGCLIVAWRSWCAHSSVRLWQTCQRHLAGERSHLTCTMAVTCHMRWVIGDRSSRITRAGPHSFQSSSQRPSESLLSPCTSRHTLSPTSLHLSFSLQYQLVSDAAFLALPSPPCTPLGVARSPRLMTTGPYQHLALDHCCRAAQAGK